MSVIKGKKLQLGYDGTASNNFTLYQPGTPDGTLKLANGIAGAETDLITLTSAGYMGIGKTNPNAPLTIGRMNSAEEGGEISLCRSSDNSSVWSIDAYGSTSTPSLRFVDNVAGAVRMNIDGSGRVTMPYQPAFAVYDLTFPSGVAGEGTGGTVLLNVGSHYNSSNGRFTAPVSGNYLFNLSIQGFNSGSTTYIDVKLRVNNSSNIGTFVTGYGGTHNNHTQVTGSITTYLNANDFAQIYVGNGARSGTQSTFNGFLIG